MASTLQQLRSDVADRPELFLWHGAYEAGSLDEWIGKHDLNVPADLRDLWLSFGAGDAFETEEFLAPFGGPEHALDFAASNEEHRTAGLPDGLFVFHDGMCLSAFRASEPRFVVVDRQLWTVKQAFRSLDAWYRGTLRREYAPLYGLKPEGP